MNFDRCCLHLKPSLRHAFIDVFAEAFRPSFADAFKVISLIAEPVARPAHLHEYRITKFSLSGAAANGLTAEEILDFLRYYTHGAPPKELPENADEMDRLLDYEWRRLGEFLAHGVAMHTKAMLVFDRDASVFVECDSEETAKLLSSDKIIRSQIRDGAASLFTKAAPRPAHSSEADQQQLTDEGATQDRYVIPLKDAAAGRYVAERAMALGVPLQQEFDFMHDNSTPRANLVLRTSAKPRDYQIAAVEAAVGTGRCRSGIIVLPCGAGKTLVGILLMCCVKRRVLVVCASTVSVEQWKNQIMEFAQIEAEPNSAANSSTGTAAGAAARGGKASAVKDRIACLTGKHKDDITTDTAVVITTFSMLAIAHKHMLKLEAQSIAAAGGSAAGGGGGGASLAGTGGLLSTTENGEVVFINSNGRKVVRRKANPKEQLFGAYGLMLLDECHAVPAEYYRESVAYVPSRAVIGLTATFVREDHRIEDLFHIIGPKLYDVPWQDLCRRGFLADVTSIELHCPMSYEFAVEYITRDVEAASTAKGVLEKEKTAATAGSAQLLTLLAACNPNKIACTKALVREHVARKHKILVFCDHILLLKKYAEELGNVPIICGETQHRDRMKIFSDFQATSKTNVVCVSRVGDVSVNLPSANVVIQVSSHGGSRRQEAQRLGRILRPKDKAADGSAVRAWFYSLVSEGTLEMRHASHRSAFLASQGYACFVKRYSEEDFVAGEVISAAAAAVGGVTPAVKREHSAITVKQESGLAEALAAVSTPAPHESFEDAVAALQPKTSKARIAWLATVVSKYEAISMHRTSAPAAAAAAMKRRGAKGNDGPATTKKERSDDDESSDESGEGAWVSDDTSSSTTDSDSADGPLAADQIAKKRVKQEPLDEAHGFALGGGSGTTSVVRRRNITLQNATLGADEDLVYHEF